VFISLLITTNGCRSLEKTTRITTIDTTFIIPQVVNKEIIADTTRLDSIVFNTPEAEVKLYTNDTCEKQQLERLKSKLVVDIKIKKKDVVIKKRIVEKHKVKQNDNPIKNFFFIFGIICAVLIILFLVIKFII